MILFGGKKDLAEDTKNRIETELEVNANIEKR